MISLNAHNMQDITSVRALLSENTIWLCIAQHRSFFARNRKSMLCPVNVIAFWVVDVSTSHVRRRLAIHEAVFIMLFALIVVPNLSLTIFRSFGRWIRNGSEAFPKCASLSLAIDQSTNNDGDQKKRSNSCHHWHVVPRLSIRSGCTSDIVHAKTRVC